MIYEDALKNLKKADLDFSRFLFISFVARANSYFLQKLILIAANTQADPHMPFSLTIKTPLKFVNKLDSNMLNYVLNDISCVQYIPHTWRWFLSSIWHKPISVLFASDKVKMLSAIFDWVECITQGALKCYWFNIQWLKDRIFCLWKRSRHGWKFSDSFDSVKKSKFLSLFEFFISFLKTNNSQRYRMHTMNNKHRT